MTKKVLDNTNKKCSFCKKSEEDVKLLIAGPNVNICDTCIKLCFDIMNKNLDSNALNQPVE